MSSLSVVNCDDDDCDIQSCSIHDDDLEVDAN